MYVFSVRAVRGVHVLDEHVHGHDFMNHKIIHAKSTSKIKIKIYINDESCFKSLNFTG